MTEHRDQQIRLPRRATFSRRRFMIGAGLVAAGGRLVPIASPASLAAAAPPRDVLAALGREDFAALVGQTFTIDTAAGHRLPVRLTTVEVPTARKMAASYPQPRLDCFTLLFRGPVSSLPQGTYQMAHPHVGQFPIFLVPQPLSRGGTEYAAVFNRLVA
ncbi:MAG TPA: hypothetical protein VHB98_16710 [Chloroflexota bacterium]|jgi:hypothetical protein|nr:hypothetical protein [Chloroflexota bacterium]